MPPKTISSNKKSKPKNSKRRTVGSENDRERVKLLDNIFSFAAEDSRPASVAPSLKLLRSWERALWRHITIYSNGGTARLLRTLNIYPQKGKPSGITWEEGEVRTHRNEEWIERCLGRFPNLTEMNFGAGMLSISTLFSLNPHLVELLPQLSICRFSEEQFNSRPIEGLRLVPKLRRVELGWVEQWDQRLENFSISAPRVTEVAIINRQCRPWITIREPETISRYFPNAVIVEIDLNLQYEENEGWIRRLVKTAGPALRTLRLQSLQEQLISSSPVDVFPNCPEVRHLHLDSSFYTDNLNAHLPHLSNLVSLSLTCDKIYPDLDNLFEGPQRLVHLKLLELEYTPIKEGQLFDIEVGEEKIKMSVYDTEKVKREIRLELEAPFGKMDGWELPFGDWVHEGIAHTARTEEKAREAGITVQSNFQELRRTYQLRLNGFHTRGVAHLHLFGNVR
ncbi:hypothetical protein JCM5350_004994 [Sporobolomyces pararoseus]